MLILESGLESGPKEKKPNLVMPELELEDGRRARRAAAQKVDYRKLNEGLTIKRELLQMDSDEDDEGEVILGDDEDAEVMIDQLLEEDFPGGRTALNKMKRKKRLAGEMEREAFPDETYEQSKDRVCACCAREIDPDDGALLSCADLFVSRSSVSGKRLLDVFRALVCLPDVRPSFFGCRLCPACVAAMENVESLHRQFRRAADAFLDAFALGQRVLDADLLGMPNTELVRSGAVAAFVSMGKVVLKVVDPAAAGFNALSVGCDFGVPVQKAYSASVVPSAEIPAITNAAVDDEAEGDKDSASCNKENEEDGASVTFVFDQDKGTIEKVASSSVVAPGASQRRLASAQLVPPEAADLRPTQLYLTQNEFDSLRTKEVQDATLFLSAEEMEGVCARLLLGHRIKQQLVLSQGVSKEYKKQIPGTEDPFTCRF